MFKAAIATAMDMLPRGLTALSQKTKYYCPSAGNMRHPSQVTRIINKETVVCTISEKKYLFTEVIPKYVGRPNCIITINEAFSKLSDLIIRFACKEYNKITDHNNYNLKNTKESAFKELGIFKES